MDSEIAQRVNLPRRSLVAAALIVAALLVILVMIRSAMHQSRLEDQRAAAVLQVIAAVGDDPARVIDVAPKGDAPADARDGIQHRVELNHLALGVQERAAANRSAVALGTHDVARSVDAVAVAFERTDAEVNHRTVAEGEMRLRVLYSILTADTV